MIFPLSHTTQTITHNFVKQKEAQLQQMLLQSTHVLDKT